MVKFLATAAVLGLLSVSAYAAQDTMTATSGAKIDTAIPQNAMTVTDWYKQDVFDPTNHKIGQVTDVLVDKAGGKVTTIMIGVGGFLGMGTKDVAVPFDQVQTTTTKNNKIHLVLNATKNELKNAPGFKWDSKMMTWVPAGQSKNKS
jgi:sporulation protein YlmC with PRC-barrel domain